MSDDVPSVLVIDDGELGRLEQVLAELGADHVRLVGDAIPSEVTAPRHLLISSGRRAMIMPRVVASSDEAPAPVWVCIYDTDFPPLRERLRELGVHFLIHGQVEADSVRLFLLQLLHQGEEKRQRRRIPIDCDVELEVCSDQRTVRLVEISGDTCRFTTDRDIPGGEAVTLRLPTSLTGGESHDLTAHRIRAWEHQPAGNSHDLSIVVRFDDLTPRARTQLDALVVGGQAGTRVTPLADEPAASDGGAASPCDAGATEGLVEPAVVRWNPDEDEDRRGFPRHPYERRVEALRWSEGEGPRVALAKDLSLSGIRVVASSRMKLGVRVALALYGGPREEPIVVDAEVVRVSGAESSLRFLEYDEVVRAQIEKLVCARPIFESLQAESPENLLVMRVLPGEDRAGR